MITDSCKYLNTPLKFGVVHQCLTWINTEGLGINFLRVSAIWSTTVRYLTITLLDFTLFWRYWKSTTMCLILVWKTDILLRYETPMLLQKMLGVYEIWYYNSFNMLCTQVISQNALTTDSYFSWDLSPRKVYNQMWRFCHKDHPPNHYQHTYIDYYQSDEIIADTMFPMPWDIEEPFLLLSGALDWGIA